MKNNFKLIVAAFAVVALSATTASAAYTHTGLLKQGSKGTQVMALQQTLNMTACKVAASGAGSTGMETTTFGPATKAAVQCFQRANALGADGVVGAMTGAKLSAIVVTDSTLPAGCTSKSGYSTTTGVKCDSTTSTPTTPGSLKGGAGNLDVSSTSKDVKSNVAEGASEKVLGLKAKAEDSDIAVTNIKVELSEVAANGSYRVNKYFDEVSIWLGDKKVGSVDADDFNRDGRSFTKSIALSNAVIADGKEANIYVMVEALSTVDNTTQTFKVKVSDLRYTDATGAILSDSISSNSVNNATFGFKPEGSDDKLTIKRVKSTADTLKVDADDESEEFSVMTFELETGKKSGDVTVNEIFIDVDFPAGVTNGADVISYIEANGVEGDFVTSTVNSARYSFDFNDDFIVDGDDSEEVEITVAFNAQDGNYGDNAKVKFTVRGAQIIAEGATDVTGSGTAASKDQTLSVSSASIAGYKWETSKTDTTAVIDFFFTVDADDEDYNVLTADISATASGSVVGVLSVVTGDATTTTGGWTVESGDVATFRVRYDFNTSGAKEVKMTSVAGKEVPQDKQLSPTIVLQ